MKAHKLFKCPLLFVLSISLAICCACAEGNKEPDYSLMQYAYTIDEKTTSPNGVFHVIMTVLDTETDARYALEIEENAWVKHAQDVYPYRWSEADDDYFLRYPNGSTFTGRIWLNGRGSNYEYISVNDSMEPYLPPRLLLGALRLMEKLDAERWRPNVGVMFAGVCLAALGLFAMLKPRALWWASEGWQYKDVEPSDTRLAMNQIAGAVALVAGVVFFVLAVKG